LTDAVNALRPKCLARGWTNEQVDLLGSQIKASSRYSFNKSHAISYAYVAYACMYLKYHYKLDWWKATLSNASKTEIASNFWPYVSDFVDLPDLNKSTEVFQIIGDRLLAPISILYGIGEKAYLQIIKSAPYASLDHFLKCHIRHGDLDDSRSAVHSGLITKMIASGIMDSFYEEGLDIEDKIYRFQEAKAKLKGKKKIDPVKEEYRSMTELGKYYAKKQLIKVYSKDLRELMLSAAKRGGKKKNDNEWIINIDHRKIPIVGGEFITAIKTQISSGKGMFMPHGMDVFGVLAYVIDEKTKQYKNKTKQATFLTVDVNGYFYEEPVWPSQEDDSAPTGFKDLPVLIIYEKSRDGSRLYTKKPIKLLEQKDIDSFNMV
jgi:DNA polymerase III alpha subunit